MSIKYLNNSLFVLQAMVFFPNSLQDSFYAGSLTQKENICLKAVGLSEPNPAMRYERSRASGLHKRGSECC